MMESFQFGHGLSGGRPIGVVRHPILQIGYPFPDPSVAVDERAKNYEQKNATGDTDPCPDRYAVIVGGL